ILILGPLGFVLGFIASLVAWGWLLRRYLGKIPESAVLLPLLAVCGCSAAINAALSMLQLIDGKLEPGMMIGGAISTFVVLFLLGLGVGWRKIWPKDEATPAEARSCRPSAAQAKPANLDQLVKLNELHDSGALTDEQFAAERARIMR